MVAGSILGLHQSLATRCEESPSPEELDPLATHLFLPGLGAAMAQVCDLIKKVAPSEATVLLLGPRGAGKHLTARIIHQLSQRSRRPWARLVCAAWDQGELERRLFGEDSGVSNGQAACQPGLLERAAGGTLYLEEVGALGLPLQARLLRVLQEGEYEPSGGGEDRRASVRVVASSTQDLEAGVAQGRLPPGPALPPGRAAHHPAAPQPAPRGRGPCWPAFSWKNTPNSPAVACA